MRCVVTFAVCSFRDGFASGPGAFAFPTKVETGEWVAGECCLDIGIRAAEGLL